MFKIDILFYHIETNIEKANIVVIMVHIHNVMCGPVREKDIDFM